MLYFLLIGKERKKEKREMARGLFSAQGRHALFDVLQ
jgi:hypothetical protein